MHYTLPILNLYYKSTFYLYLELSASPPQYLTLFVQIISHTLTILTTKWTGKGGMPYNIYPTTSGLNLHCMRIRIHNICIYIYIYIYIYIDSVIYKKEHHNVEYFEEGKD